MSPMKIRKKARTGRKNQSDGLFSGFVVGESNADPTKVPRFSDKMRIFEKFCSLTDLDIYAHKTEHYGRKEYLKRSKALCSSKKSGSSGLNMIEDDIKSCTFARTTQVDFQKMKPRKTSDEPDNRKMWDPPVNPLDLKANQVPKLKEYKVRSPHARDGIFHCVINA